MATIEVLEFYSGIGGVHYALKEACSNSTVVAAYDINPTANMIYTENFPDTTVCQNNIQAILVQHLEKLNAQLWTMSPPCQPFTKKGSQQGIDDHRCDSFMALMKKLKQMRKRPRYIFLENVLGFETSSVHKELISTLTELHYGYQREIERLPNTEWAVYNTLIPCIIAADPSTLCVILFMTILRGTDEAKARVQGIKCHNEKEFILSPLQFGVPNSRPRYYLLACSDWCVGGAATDISTTFEGSYTSEPKEMQCFLDDSHSNNHHYLSKSNLQKYGPAVDVVTFDSKRSACFTKSYGTYISGCGSYFCTRPDLMDGHRLTPQAVADGGAHHDVVRLFSPREVANLMCFPAEFKTPANATDKQMYRCLGNSVNVRVVAALLGKLLG